MTYGEKEMPHLIYVVKQQNTCALETKFCNNEKYLLVLPGNYELGSLNVQCGATDFMRVDMH